MSKKGDKPESESEVPPAKTGEGAEGSAPESSTAETSSSTDEARARGPSDADDASADTPGRPEDASEENELSDEEKAERDHELELEAEAKAKAELEPHHYIMRPVKACRVERNTQCGKQGGRFPLVVRAGNWNVQFADGHREEFEDELFRKTFVGPMPDDVGEQLDEYDGDEPE